eukprot:CAMPEP_0177581324 /NCGR_PEP_ID=MMETSP0419_2-20121207/2082_1 /TAXON_ID=582737 /ORGANISM="Tetraselmis sp., Strain GSL018" /LENGTH=172 /DNA_ID=CAMNT_0019070349 /DNA_START=266 /DNA_END=786 /DNA_ORIENTATION=-
MSGMFSILSTVQRTDSLTLLQWAPMSSRGTGGMVPRDVCMGSPGDGLNPQEGAFVAGKPRRHKADPKAAAPEPRRAHPPAGGDDPACAPLLQAPTGQDGAAGRSAGGSSGVGDTEAGPSQETGKYEGHFMEMLPTKDEHNRNTTERRFYVVHQDSRAELAAVGYFPLTKRTS